MGFVQWWLRDGSTSLFSWGGGDLADGRHNLGHVLHSASACLQRMAVSLGWACNLPPQNVKRLTFCMEHTLQGAAWLARVRGQDPLKKVPRDANGHQ